MQSLFRTTSSTNINESMNISDPNFLSDSLTTPSTFAEISDELLSYFDTHRERIPLLVIVYLLTIVWILYLILYHSRVQGLILSYVLRRFYFYDATQIKFDSFSISFISGAIMFRNLHYTTGSYFVFVKHGCLVFRYWSKAKKKPAIRLKIQLNQVHVQVFSPIRSNTVQETNDEQPRGSINGISAKVEDAQSVNTVKSNEEGLFVKRLRSLFPAIEIKVDHGRISIGHDTVPYGLLIRFSAMNSTFTSQSPSKNAPEIDLMTLLYSLTYKNLRIQLYPMETYKEEQRENPPLIPTSKSIKSGVFQVFECSEGELEYEQDVPGKMTEMLMNEQAIPDVAWKISIKCNKDTKIAYGPWADRQREYLWQYFLPTIYEDSPITPEPSVGQTRIFKSVHFSLIFNCSTKLDLYFMSKQTLHKLHVECPTKGSSFNAIFPFSTNPNGFDTSMTVNLLQPTALTNLSFSPLVQAENVHIKVNIHYPRLWNALQDWFIDIDAKKAQVYFVFEHKNFFQALINDWASSLPPDISSFTPFIYNLTLRGNQIELLVPCNQGNWIDCAKDNNTRTAENNYISLCAKSLLLTYPLSFLEFCPTATAMDLSVEVDDVLARLIIPENNRMFYLIEGLDKHKRFYTPTGLQSHLELAKEFDQRNGSFECGQVAHLKIFVQILLHSSPPVDMSQKDLSYIQQIKSMGNRQTFHPSKLEYDVFNIEIDMGPVDLLLHGLFLKKLWWVKENLFGWDQVYHVIEEPDLIREKKITVHDDPLLYMIDESQTFDPRVFRPLMVTVRVALHNMTIQLLHHTDNEPCPIAFCERLCVEMTTDLDETRLQVLFLPVNVYIEDTITRNKSDQHLSTGSLQLAGLVLRGHAMLSHEGLPPERETLEYAWQMEILLGKVSARLTTIQMEKTLSVLKNFYLQMMEDEYTLIRSPVMDKTKWIEKLKYDVLRFSLDSVDFSLIEIGNAVHVQAAPIRLCMCNMHTSACNESLTLKVGVIEIRQLLRLYPGSWLEAGSLHLPELRINAKFDCHPPTPVNITEQIEFLRRHDQNSQRLHFLYSSRSQQPTTSSNLKRPSNFGLPSNTSTASSCACLGGSSTYYTLVSGEQFFKNSYRLSEQPSFGRSLFRPDVHVIFSHPVFEQKYTWKTYEPSDRSNEQLSDEEVFCPFDFCAQQNQPISPLDIHSHHSVPTDLFNLSRSNSLRVTKRKSFVEPKLHKRSSSSIPINSNSTDALSSSAVNSNTYLTASEQSSLSSSNGTNLNPFMETSTTSSVTVARRQSSTHSSPIPTHFDLSTTAFDERDDDVDLSFTSSHSTSTDSLTALEEILQSQQVGHAFPSTTQKNTSSSTEHKSHPQPSLPGSSWISLRSQMKMPIPKSTLLCTTYIRYLSHYRSSTWSSTASFPPSIGQDQINHRPLLDFNCVSQGFSCSFLSEPPTSAHSRPQFPSVNPRHRFSIASNIIATEKEICIRFNGALNILFTPLMLECLTTYIDKWKTYDLHPMSILDGLHFQSQTNSNPPSTSIDLSATKLSLTLPKINLCLLQAGLAEDNVQLAELRTPVDIVTMSLFALSCKQIQMETILSKHDQSTAGVFKIQSITGQFRRFENDFSSIDDLNIHAIQSQRCRLQFHIGNEMQTHLPIGNNRNNFGFVMNEFGLQRLCFKLINNAAKQQQERKQIVPTMTQIDETQTVKAPTKQKSKRKQSVEPSLPSPSTTAPPTINLPPATSSPSSSSVFDGSIDHVWISFPEPPRHTNSTSSLSKRSRISTTASTQQLPTQKKPFSYTRYDWNFLSTLSPTVLGWFCVIDRVKQPVTNVLQKREKYFDAVLAYFLIEKKPSATLPQSKLYHLFTPKTKYLLSHPVCQLVTEFRKYFNQKTDIQTNLQPDLIPEIELLKQGIRAACHDWAEIFKQQPHPYTYIVQSPASATTTSPINTIVPTNSTDQEQPSILTRRRTSTIVDRMHRLIRHESIEGNQHRPSVTFRQAPNGIENTTELYSAARRRTTVDNTRANANNKETVIEMTAEPSSMPERRRASTLLAPSTGYDNTAFDQAETLRRLEPTANINNNTGYRRLNMTIDESDYEGANNGVRSSNVKQDGTHNPTIYHTDLGAEFAGSVEQLFKILLEYAGVELSVTSSIEPLFEKLGQTVLAFAQIKRFDIKILPNELINATQVSVSTPAIESSILDLTNLNIQSVCRQSLDHDQLHSANVQVGIHVQRVKQEVNLSLLRLVYQFYAVFGNAVEYTGIDEVTKTETNVFQPSEDLQTPRSRTNTLTDQSSSGIQHLVLKTLQPELLRNNNNDLANLERECWKKLRDRISPPDRSTGNKQIPTTTATRKQPRRLSQPQNDAVSQPTTDVAVLRNDTLLISAFGWLIIDEIHYGATLGGLKVDACMRRVQGSVSLSQRLRAVQTMTNNQNSKKYDGSLIVQLGSTTLSLKETLSTAADNPPHPTSTNSNQTSANTSTSARQISVLDVIIGKSRALTSLQTRGTSLTLSGVTNIGTIAMDVPLRPQEVHDLVNRAGRLITSYVQEFLPDDTQQPPVTPSENDKDLEQVDMSLNDTIEESSAPISLTEQNSRRKRSHIRRKLTVTSIPASDVLETQQSVSSNARKALFQVHITAQCQGMTFSTTLLPTLKAQYKIGIVEGVANIGSTTSRFTAVIHEHALHFLNNNNTNSPYQLPTVSSDNHVRIDFPQIRCYGNYIVEHDYQNKPKGHLSLRTKIDLLKLTITADFLAQLVFVSKVIIHEINEILAKVSGFEQFHFGATKPMIQDKDDTLRLDEEAAEEDDEEEKSPPTIFTYKIDITIKGFKIIGQTPSSTFVKIANGDKKRPIFIKLTNYDEQNSLILYDKPLIKAMLFIKLSLGQLLHTGGSQDAAYFKTNLLVKNSFQSDEFEREAYFIRLTKPSFYWQPGAIDKGILFWLNYKNTYEYWNEQRGAFTTSSNDSTHLRSLVNVQASPATKAELNLMFQLHIIDLGIAIPLQQLDQPTKLSSTSSTNDNPSVPISDESGDFLVFTLDQTTISACSCGAIISTGSFENFCLRFAENFQQTNSDWKPTRSVSSSPNVILNACCVPSGQYLMHSRAKNVPNSPSPKWFLNVQWDMKGIVINIDSIIGKRFSQLIRTITSTRLIRPIDNLNADDDLTSNSNLLNTQSGSGMNINENIDPTEDDERKKRIQFEYSILGQKIEALKRSQASDEVLQAEQARYQYLEQELLNTVKTGFQQKMKKQTNKTALARDRTRNILSTLSVPNSKRTQSQDYPQIPRNPSGRRYSLIYAAALASSSNSDHRRISTLTTSQSQMPPSPIQEEETEDDTMQTATTTLRSISHQSDDRQSSNPSEITSAPAVDFELNIHIQIASGSCNLYTRRDLISHSPVTPNLTKQQTQAITGLIQTINKIEYQVSQFSLPGVEVDAHYSSKHNNPKNSALNKKGSFYCRANIQSPKTQIIIHPILLDFIEQTLEYVKLPREQQRRPTNQDEQVPDPNADDDHLNTMFLAEDQTSTASFPIDVGVSIFIKPCVLLFTCLPTHPMECELCLPAVDVVFSSKHSSSEQLSSSTDANPLQQILDNSLTGLSFSLYMKDFKLNVYHPFSGESKVHLFEDIRAGQLQTRNALAVSVQSISVNISRTRYISIDRDNQPLSSIQLSVIAQISRAQFEYDIRRFSEVLTFPKIWYNRALARRLFLGDEQSPTRIAPSNKILSSTVPTPSAPSTHRVVPKHARVLLAIQLKELHVSMRMSNVLGKVEWNTKDVSSTGSLTLTSDGKRTLFVSLGLQKSVLQAEQGIVGGLVQLQNLRAIGLMRQELRDRSWLVDASHVIDLLTDAIEVRLDYMGSPTLMGRICHISLRLKDDRHSSAVSSPSGDSLPPSTLVLFNLGWSQLHLMITRSTTPDIIKMAMKLIEFYNAQVASSKTLLSTIQYDFRDRTKRDKSETKKEEKISSNSLSKLNTMIIKRHIGMNGGELMLQGDNLTLVIFHGLNFKSRQWAFFSLNEPQINFITDRGEKGDINQKLFFYLGRQTTHASLTSRSNMASISKVTRNSPEAPAQVTISEWFNYASSTISAVGLRDFPSMSDPATPVVTSKVRSKYLEQNTESIFILPALELRFQTRQLEGQVHCSFETDFYEHIMFTFNAEHFYFLHDLISSYIKEKERTLPAAAVKEKVRSPPAGASNASPDQQTPPSSDEAPSDDKRKFICPDTKWKLQPTIKLLTAYGNEVEPFGADYILQKLGFRHARLTIPKWVQRGVMDPCEQSMTIVQLILIFLLPERFKEMCIKSG